MSNYSHSSPFANLLGSPDRINLLDVFLSKGHRPLSVDELVDFTGLSPDTVREHCNVLESANLVELDGDMYILAETDDADMLRAYHLQSHNHLEEISNSTDSNQS